MSNAHGSRHPALIPLFDLVAPLGVDVTDSVLKVKPSAFVLPDGRVPSVAQRLGFTCLTILAAERAFTGSEDKNLTVWDAARDEVFMDALETLRALDSALYARVIKAATSLWSASMLSRVIRALEPFGEDNDPTPTARIEKAGADDTFRSLWLTALNGFSAAFNALVGLRNKAAAKRSVQILTKIIPEQSGALLELFERGTETCPPLERILADWLVSLHVEFDGGTLLECQKYRWAAIRWAGLLAEMAGNEASKQRFDQMLVAAKTAHPEAAGGPGIPTLVLYLGNGVIRPVTPGDAEPVPTTPPFVSRED